MEATGTQAEYIRDGLDYQAWLHNVDQLLQAGRVVHFMCTINALCLTTLPEHLDRLMDLKRRWGRDSVNFTLNILRFPSFQSPLVLPDNLREQFRAQLIEFMVRHKGSSTLHEHEWHHMQRLVDYLDRVKTPHSEAFDMPKLHNDFRKFFDQYDQRRGKNFAVTFPQLKDWYESIQI
jgi:hypothetical protein